MDAIGRAFIEALKDKEIRKLILSAIKEAEREDLYWYNRVNWTWMPDYNFRVCYDAEYTNYVRSRELLTNHLDNNSMLEECDKREQMKYRREQFRKFTESKLK